MSVRTMAWAWNQELKPAAKLVLLALSDHADDRGKCWPGITGVAEKTGLSRRSVQRHLRDLEETGLVRTQVRLDESGRQTSSTYVLAVSRGVTMTPRSDTDVTPEGDASVAPEGVTVTPKSSIRTIRETTTITPAASDGKTAETWKAYANAYRSRYGVDPIRNSKVNGQLAQLVDRIGKDETPQVAEFYVKHNGPLYVNSGHAVGLLLRDAEKLRTEWFTGKTIQARPIARKTIEDYRAEGSNGERGFIPATAKRLA